jgi:tRNA A-37 threonylcarbamoyl transferase component Bud32
MEKSKNTEDLKEYNLIIEALIKFGVQDKIVEFIRHNENLTLKINGEYLLRIHKSADTFQAINQYVDINIKQMRYAEIAFLEHLRKSGMNVQIPVRSNDNAYVVEVSDGIYATMLHWISGDIIKKEEVTIDLCFEIGQMVARMHKAAIGFSDENILQYDSNLFMKLRTCFSHEKIWSNIQDKHRLLLDATFERISERLKDTHEFITVHSDLSLSNMLITQSGLVPIDFSLFGFAHPMMDIGCLFGCINGVENRAAIAGGYRSLGYDIDFPMLDTHFALSVLLYVIIHLNLCNEEDFNKNLDRWCKQIFLPFIQGERLISENFYMLNADK